MWKCMENGYSQGVIQDCTSEVPRRRWGEVLCHLRTGIRNRVRRDKIRTLPLKTEFTWVNSGLSENE